MVTEWKFSNTAKLSLFIAVFAPIFAYVHSVLHIDRKSVISSTSSRDGSFARRLWCDTSRQSAVKFVKTWMLSHSTSEQKDPSYDSATTYQNATRKIGGRRGEFRWLYLHPRKSNAEADQEPKRWYDYSSDLAWSRLSDDPAEVSKGAETREVFKELQRLLRPQSFREEKRMFSVSEWVVFCCSQKPYLRHWSKKFSDCLKSYCLYILSKKGFVFSIMEKAARVHIPDVLGVRAHTQSNWSWLNFSRSCDQGKITKSWKIIRTSCWFSEPNFKTIPAFNLLDLADMLSITSFPCCFLMWQLWVCANATAHLCL